MGGSQESSGWTYRVLGYLLSQQKKIPKENCTILPLHFFAGYNNTGECRLTTQNYSHALSPAFLIDGKKITFISDALKINKLSI